MIKNEALIELAGHYLGLLKNEFYTFAEFDAKMKVLIDLTAYDKDRDTFKIRDALIVIRQVGEKWK